MGGLCLSALLSPLSADLVAVWKLDGDATDSSGNGHDGEVIDGAFSDDTPEVLVGQSFSPEGGHIEVPHSEELSITQAITISVFVKPEENAWEGIIAKNPSDGSAENHAGNYELRINSGGRWLDFLFQRGGSDDTVTLSAQSAVVESNVWSHVAVTADVESGDVNFYLNGELIETLKEIIAVDEFPANENPLYIGSRADLFTMFDGLIDELSLWNEALDADRIALLAEGPASLEDAPDADGDGIPDFFEERFAFLDPNNAADGEADQDGDGVSNAAEFAARTNLESDDTDEDGLSDGVETNTGVFVSASDRGTDPRRADTDGDGLADGVESNSGTFVDASDPGTNLLLADTDEDTFSDFVEVTLGSHPLDPASQPDGIVFADSGESWDLGTSWTDGQPPVAGKSYLVVSSVAPVIESPASANPVFGGDRLNLIGPETQLILNHSGTASIPELGIDGGTLAKERRGAGGLGVAGDTLTFTHPSTIDLRQPGVFSIGATLAGTSSIMVKTSGNEALASNSTLELRASNSGFSGDWHLENVTLKGTGVDALGSGNVTLLNAIFDLDYNLNNVDGSLDISGEDSRIFLDQTLAFGQLTINGGALEVPAGVYDFEGLGTVFEGGLQPIFVNSGGLLVVGGDSDSDGLPDFWEEERFGNLEESGDGDGDGDGLSNTREFLFGTNPGEADTDGDGLTDLEEIEGRGSDPTLADTDEDGLSDLVESNTGVFVSAEDRGTDPARADTDGDGLEDGVEDNSGVFVSAEATGTDPNNRDTDGDGGADGAEVRAGSNPLDGNDASSIPDGTVGLWTFDADGPVQPDLSGSGNDATVEGASWVDDPERGGVMMIGDNQHLEVPDADSLDIAEAITIAAWVKPIGEIGWDGILAKNPSDDSAPNHAGNYEWRIENGGRFVHFLHQQGGTDDTAFHEGQSSIIAPDVWTHVVVTADIVSGDVAFYINGELSETLEGIIGVDEFPVNENPLIIGSRADFFTPMNGFLDDVMLLNRAVGADEVPVIMLGGFSGGGDPGNGGGPRADFAISNVRTGTGGNIRFEVVSADGESYALEFSENLIDWEVRVDAVASEGAMTVIRTPLPEGSQGFFRMRLK